MHSFMVCQLLYHYKHLFQRTCIISSIKFIYIELLSDAKMVVCVCMVMLRRDRFLRDSGLSFPLLVFMKKHLFDIQNS